MSDALSAVPPPTNVLPSRVFLNKPCVLYVELENVSEHRLSLSLVDLNLDTTYFRVSDNPLMSPLITHTKHSQSLPVETSTNTSTSKRTSSVSNSTPSPIVLTPNDRFTGLFHFVPILKGTPETTKTPQLVMQWCRASAPVSVDRSSGSGSKRRQFRALTVTGDAGAAAPNNETDDYDDEDNDQIIDADTEGQVQMDTTATANSYTRAATATAGSNKATDTAPTSQFGGSVDLAGDESSDSSSLCGGAAAAPARVRFFSSDSALDSSVRSLHVTYTRALPVWSVIASPLEVSVAYPPACTVGDAIPITITLNNTTDKLHDIEFSVLDGFDVVGRMLLSGRKVGSLRLLPRTSQTIVYHAAPVECGFQPIPRIQIKSSVTNQLLLDPADFSASTVFVHPRTVNNLTHTQSQSQTQTQTQTQPQPHSHATSFPIPLPLPIPVSRASLVS